MTHYLRGPKVKMSCPWANIKQPEPVRLDDIISEEIARDLQAKELNEFYKQSDST